MSPYGLAPEEVADKSSVLSLQEVRNHTRVKDEEDVAIVLPLTCHVFVWIGLEEVANTAL